MVNSSKKLPCGHIFHTTCLRSWFQRQQTCPTCRLNILRTPVTSTQQQQAAVHPPQMNNQNTNDNQNIGNNNNNNNNLNNNNILGVNPFANLMTPPTTDLISGTSASFTGTTAFPIVPSSPLLLPSMPFMAPYAMPPLPMPSNLDTLTDDELRILEGVERQNVEARIKLLRNVQLMLNASVALMNQYNAIISQVQLPVPTTIPTRNDIPSTVIPQIFNIPPDVPIASSTLQNPTITQHDTTSTSSSHQPQLSTSKTVIDTDIETVYEEVKIENLGSEEHLERPSCSHDTEANELRRRRLQKFFQPEQNNSTNN